MFRALWHKVATILDAILKIQNCSMMTRWHHSDYSKARSAEHESVKKKTLDLSSRSKWFSARLKPPPNMNPPPPEKKKIYIFFLNFHKKLHFSVHIYPDSPQTRPTQKNIFCLISQRLQFFVHIHPDPPPPKKKKFTPVWGIMFHKHKF